MPYTAKVFFLQFLYFLQDFWNYLFDMLVKSDFSQTITQNAQQQQAANTFADGDTLTFAHAANLYSIFAKGNEKEKMDVGFTLFGGNSKQDAIEAQEVYNRLHAVYSMLDDKYKKELPDDLQTPELAMKHVMTQDKMNKKEWTDLCAAKLASSEKPVPATTAQPQQQPAAASNK